MTKTYQHITEANKLSLNKPHDDNVVYFSELNRWSTDNAFRAFSLKYVQQGVIEYRTLENSYSVKQGQILIASKQPGVSAFFESKGITKSICIDISSSVLDEVFSFKTAKYTREFENLSNGAFKEARVIEKLSDPSSMGINPLLKSIWQIIQMNNDYITIADELFYTLAEVIVDREFLNSISSVNLPFTKLSTRQEVFRRIANGKEYIDQEFLSIKGITEISNVCMMSTYHFIRNFKQVYKVTPYQYLLTKKLVHAAELISAEHDELKNIAMICGFPDISSFSKAFKKKYNVCPSRFNLR